MIENKRFDVSSDETPKNGQNVTGDAFESNADLLNELNEMLKSSTEESFDFETFESRLEQLQQKSPVMDDFDAETGLKRLKETHALFFENGTPEYGSTTAENSTNRKERLHSVVFKEVFKRVVAAVLIIAALGVGVAYAAGVDVFGALAEWTKETFSFTYATDSEEEISVPPQNIGTCSDLQSALDEYGVTEKLVPKYIPEGYEQVEFNVSTESDYTSFAVGFIKDDRAIIVSITKNMLQSGAKYQKDEGDPEVYETGGVSHYIMTNSDNYKVVWVNGDFECSISGLAEKDELIKIIESIYEE